MKKCSWRLSGILCGITCIVLWSFGISCGNPDKQSINVQKIDDPRYQQVIFNKLVKLVGNAMPEEIKDDSLSFLILPLQASCPSCRKKTIDSISEHMNSLGRGKFVIISSNAGLKTINSYFKEVNKDISSIPIGMILDSSYQAMKEELCDDRPVMYYTNKQRVYRKVGVVPSTVRQDLHEFFSTDL